jgi:hypothetical protein
MTSKKNGQMKKAATNALKGEKQEKPLTTKQAATRADSLLRGIDNSAVAIKKHQEIIEQNIEQVRSIVAGIGNQTTVSSTVPKSSTSKSAVKKPEAKTTKKAAPKPASKPSQKAAQKPSQKAEQPQGPTIKEAAATVLKESGGVLKASEIWHKAQEKYKRTWSRQVLYNALTKNQDIFVPSGDGYRYGGVAKPAQTVSPKRESDVDSFIEKASKNEAVSNVL